MYTYVPICISSTTLTLSGNDKAAANACHLTYILHTLSVSPLRMGGRNEGRLEELAFQGGLSGLVVLSGRR